MGWISANRPTPLNTPLASTTLLTTVRAFVPDTAENTMMPLSVSLLVASGCCQVISGAAAALNPAVSEGRGERVLGSPAGDRPVSNSTEVVEAPRRTVISAE